MPNYVYGNTLDRRKTLVKVFNNMNTGFVFKPKDLFTEGVELGLIDSDETKIENKHKTLRCRFAHFLVRRGAAEVLSEGTSAKRFCKIRDLEGDEAVGRNWRNVPQPLKEPILPMEELTVQQVGEAVVEVITNLKEQLEKSLRSQENLENLLEDFRNLKEENKRLKIQLTNAKEEITGLRKQVNGQSKKTINLVEMQRMTRRRA